MNPEGIGPGKGKAAVEIVARHKLIPADVASSLFAQLTFTTGQHSRHNHFFIQPFRAAGYYHAAYLVS